MTFVVLLILISIVLVTVTVLVSVSTIGLLIDKAHSGRSVHACS